MNVQNKNLVPQQVYSGSAYRSISEWIYTTEWAQLSERAQEPHTSVQVPAGSWTLLSTSSTESLSKQWREHLQKGKMQYKELHLSNSLVSLGERLIEQLALQDHRSSANPGKIIVFLSDEESSENQTAVALNLIQHLLKFQGRFEVWFVAQLSVAGKFSLSAAALRGFSRSLSLDQPTLAGGWLALDPETSVETAIAALIDAGDEDLLWVQGDTVWAPRLRRKMPALVAPPVLKNDRSYLVTGAFGRLGRGIVDWLEVCGARHVVLIGRTPPSDTDPIWMERREACEARGLRLRVEACDVADERAVGSLLTRLAEEGLPVAGVVHAAAGMQFAPLAELHKADIDTAFRAKVEGARVLHRCTRNRHLDFFILFGSASAKVGLRDGVLYAAANSCLEALAMERRSLDLPATCVEWGLWKAGTSTVPVGTVQLERIESSGFHAMENPSAFAALNALLASGEVSAVVADIDWSVLGPALRSLHKDGIVKELLAAITNGSTQSKHLSVGSSWLESIRQLSPNERYAELHHLVSEKVAEVFGLSVDELDDNAGFFDLGMDSLMGLALQADIEDRIGIHLERTLTLNYPNVATLTRFLNDMLFPSDSVSAKGIGKTSPTAEPIATLDEPSIRGMSDAEVNDAIQAELAAASKLGLRTS